MGCHALVLYIALASCIMHFTCYLYETGSRLYTYVMITCEDTRRSIHVTAAPPRADGNFALPPRSGLSDLSAELLTGLPGIIDHQGYIHPDRVSASRLFLLQVPFSSMISTHIGRSLVSQYNPHPHRSQPGAPFNTIERASLDLHQFFT